MKCLILRVRVGSRHTGRQTREKEKAPLFVVLSHGAYRECGILPGEEMLLTVSTESVISRDCIPSAKQVREFAPPYEASDTEAAEQCFEPDSHKQ